MHEALNSLYVKKYQLLSIYSPPKCYIYLQKIIPTILQSTKNYLKLHDVPYNQIFRENFILNIIMHREPDIESEKE